MDRFGKDRADADLMIRVLVAASRGSRRKGVAPEGAPKVDWPALIRPFLREARELAVSDAPLDRRLPAVELVGMEEGPQSLDLLARLLDARHPVQVQLAALQALARSADPSIGRLVVAQWKAMSPAVRREATELLFGRRDRLELLIAALGSKAIPANEIDPDRLKQLRGHRDPHLRALAEQALGPADATTSDRRATIDAFRQATTLPGVPESGRAVFQKTCATCHRVQGQGIDVGPDLATVAGRSPDDLLLHILDPNREVAPNYVNYNVATTNGRTVSGIIVSESAAALTLSAPRE